MTNTLLAAVLLATTTLPAGWHLAGSRPQDYDSGVDAAIAASGKRSAYLSSAAADPGGFATLMQTFRADHYLGKRLRLRASVRAENVEKWAGVWMRVDGADSRPVAFDNMQKRPIRGTSEWRTYDVVLDVPESAVNIAFGILLEGTGKVWIDTITFDEVDMSVPTTGRGISRTVALRPAHLDFEE